MKKAWLFAKRNILEMFRDPILYIFCAGFPVGMLILFNVISSFSVEMPLVFSLDSLIPGVMMFSYSLLMLMAGLLISKDRSTSFVKRLFTSPLKSIDFIVGYFVPFFFVGLCQNIVTILTGFIISLLTKTDYINFVNCLLLVLEMLPIMIINIMFGMLFGTILNDKSAPGICSIFISACGVLGGAWMPIDTMGDFENVVSFMPFYPSVYLGRVITGASRSIPNELGELISYSFNPVGWLYVLNISVYLIVSIILAIVVFEKRMCSAQ